MPSHVSDGAAKAEDENSELASLDDDTVCIWNPEARGYTVESDLILMTRSATVIFEDGVSQKLFLQNSKSNVRRR